VLGTLLRARVTGLFRLTEVSGRSPVGSTASICREAKSSRSTRRPGCQRSARSSSARFIDGAAQRQIGLRLVASRDRRVGELLVEECRISPVVVGRSARQQLRARLTLSSSIEEAMLSFHVACALPKDPPPLAPREYLHGRPRARDRGPFTGRRGEDSPRKRTNVGQRTDALSLLGLDEDASVADVTRAFRELASRVHPDRHPGADDAIRRAMQQRFAALSAAYHSLIG